jgi:hypothetical protein
MSNYELLKQKIQEAIPKLMAIEIGQIFHSKYYGNIIATKVKKHSQNTYSIYGFDTIEGLPRDNYYPIDLKLVGKEPMLNDILGWLKSISEYTDEYCITIGGDFLKMNFIQSSFELINLHTNPRWDMSKTYLKEQNQELINYLCTLGKVSPN